MARCLLLNFWTRYFETNKLYFDAKWHKKSTGKGTGQLYGQEVKDQGHKKPKIG